MQQILMLDNGGRPCQWATLEEAFSWKRREAIAWGLGEDLEFYGGISQKTGERSILRMPPIIAVKNQTFVGKVPFNNATLFARDNYTCCYCALRFPRGMLTREHIHPQSRGGATNWLNCASACKICNGRKGDKLLSECGMELVYLPYVPNAAEGLILSGRNIIADQMEVLKACLPNGSRVLAQYQ
jgi:hypothetical protein